MLKTLQFDKHKFDFSKYFEDFFECDLVRLHNKYDFGEKFIDVTGGMKSIDVIETAYNAVIKTDSFSLMWTKFLSTVIKPLFKQNIYYQKLPSLRIFPADHSVKYVDKVCDGMNVHLDSESPFYHPTFETNFWLPLMGCDHLNDFYYIDGNNWKQRANIEKQDMLMFDSFIIHGNYMHNKSFNTRVSLDFKIVPEDQYDKSVLTDIPIIKRGKKFKQKEFFTTDYYYNFL